MEKQGFFLTIAASLFTIFLIGWQGTQQHNADWVPGFLAVFWSLVMMLRLLTLTRAAQEEGGRRESAGLAQKIIFARRQKGEEARQKTLDLSFGGSFQLFLFACFLFAGWQIYCAIFPQQGPSLESLETLMKSVDAGISMAGPRLFDWAYLFLHILAFCMMAFVLRTYAPHRSMTRAFLIILGGYALSGLIVFAGLDATAADASAMGGFYGNGAGSSDYFSPRLQDSLPTLFDIVLIESGAGGMALLAFILFVPLGSLALSGRGTDQLILTCGILTGLALIGAVFLPATPYLGAFITMCAAGLFLAWGASEAHLVAPSAAS